MKNASRNATGQRDNAATRITWAFPQFLLWNFGVLGQALNAIVRAWGWGYALIAAASLVVLGAAVLMLAMFYRNALGDRPALSAGRAA